MKILVFIIIFTGLISCSSLDKSVNTDNVSHTPQLNESMEVPPRESPPRSTHFPNIKLDKNQGKPPLGKKNSQQPLKNSEIVKNIRNTIPKSFLPVTDDEGKMQIIYEDLDNNGLKDAFFLTIKRKKNVDSRLSFLSDVSRLTEKRNTHIDYFLSVYLQINGEMVSMYRIPLGTEDVLASFNLIHLKKRSRLPFALKTGFTTLRGSTEEWVIFSGYNRFSFFNSTNDTSAAYELKDIDNDGILDIINWKYGLEEGTGYETYLTWYRWDGKEYREYRTTTIVRKLNSFLTHAAEQMLQQDWNSFWKTNILPEKQMEVLSQPVIKNINKIFAHFASPASGGTTADTGKKANSNGESEEKLICTDFRSIVFPTILENPFEIKKGIKREIKLPVRMECNDGTIFIGLARIGMSDNPFKENQYFFIF